VGPQFIVAIRPTLEEAGQWDDETQSAWTHLFDVIDYVMTASMYEDEKTKKHQKDWDKLANLHKKFQITYWTWYMVGKSWSTSM